MSKLNFELHFLLICIERFCEIQHEKFSSDMLDKNFSIYWVKVYEELAILVAFGKAFFEREVKKKSEDEKKYYRKIALKLIFEGVF